MKQVPVFYPEELRDILCKAENIEFDLYNIVSTLFPKYRGINIFCLITIPQLEKMLNDCIVEENEAIIKSIIECINITILPEYFIVSCVYVDNNSVY